MVSQHQESSSGSTQTQRTFEEDKREKTLRILGVTDLNNSFDSMRLPPGFEKSLRAFKDMARRQSSRYMLLVYGGTGNGKTMCCEATVIELYERGIRCRRDRWSDIVRHLKELMRSGGYEAYFQAFRARHHLIIDDVGSGSTLGPWEWGELEDIVDYRLEQKLFTIITTNLDGKQIPERIISRFKDKRKARIIFNEAEDQRPLEEEK